MVDDSQIKAQAAQLFKKQFLRGSDQWDIRLDPDYQEFILQKQREERKNVSIQTRTCSSKIANLFLSFIGTKLSAVKSYSAYKRLGIFVSYTLIRPGRPQSSGFKQLP